MTTSAWGGSFGEAPNSAWGDSFGFDGFTPPTPTTPTGPPPGGGNYLAWWERELRRILAERKKRKKKKLPEKKQELVQELEDKVDELALVAAEKEITQAYARELRAQVVDSAILVNQAYQAKVSSDRLRAEIAAIEIYLRELDDEETILLAIH